MKIKNEQISKLWDMLSDFVYETCADRDPSHGHEHMEAVARNALHIWQRLFPEQSEHAIELAEIILYAAWLHDVADHKYDADGSLKQIVGTFLQEHNPEHAEHILNIVDRVSFSKEVTAIEDGSIDQWPEILGRDGMMVRDIVSDSDKLEALGQIGLARCVEYIKHVYRSEGKEISDEQIVNDVKQHAQKKILRLKDEFIRTHPGKELAQPLHDEFLEGIQKMVNNKKPH